MGTQIDLNNWNRKEIFDFFSNLSNPFYMVSFRQDVTGLYNYAKKNNLSFYYCLCYLVTKALNSVDAFNYVIKGKEIYHLEGRNPSFTDLKKNTDTFHIVTMPLIEGIKEFAIEAKIRSEKQDNFIDMEEESDELVYLSCLPWLDLTALTNERNIGDVDDSVPRVCWGKYTKTNDKVELGISIEVNHRLIDGVHIGKFHESLNKLIEELD